MDFPSLKAADLAGTGRRLAIAEPDGSISGASALIYSDLASVTSASTTKSTLKSCHLPANLLAAPGVKGLKIRAWGTCKATANNKTQTVDIETTGVVSTGAVGNNGGVWYVEAFVMRKAVDSQECVGTSLSATTAAATRAALTKTESARMLVEVTATNVTDTDGTVCTGFTIELLF